MATINLGNLTFTHKGDYDGSTAYVKNDVVYYSTNGNAYIAKQATTGNLPTSTAHWNIFSQGSGGIWNGGLSLGSAGQVVKVNSGASALEFGDAGGGLLQVKTFRKSSAWSLGSSASDRVEAAPFDGTASITPSATDSVIMATCTFVIKHGTTWRSGIGRLQFSTDGGSNYSDFGMMTASAYNDGTAMSGNDYTGTFIIPNQNTTNEHKIRLYNMPHNNGHNHKFGGSTDTDTADTSSVSTYGTGATLTLFEFDGSIHTLSTTA